MAHIPKLSFDNMAVNNMGGGGQNNLNFIRFDNQRIAPRSIVSSCIRN